MNMLQMHRALSRMRGLATSLQRTDSPYEAARLSQQLHAQVDALATPLLHITLTEDAAAKVRRMAQDNGLPPSHVVNLAIDQLESMFRQDEQYPHVCAYCGMRATHAPSCTRAH